MIEKIVEILSKHSSKDSIVIKSTFSRYGAKVSIDFLTSSTNQKFKCDSHIDAVIDALTTYIENIETLLNTYKNEIKKFNGNECNYYSYRLPHLEELLPLAEKCLAFVLI